jgi:hypothetical protein
VICLYVFEDYIDSGLLSATPKQIKICFYREYECAEKCVALLLGGGKILLGVPDSWHSGDSAQVVAEYNQFEGCYPGLYFEVSGPALRCTTKTYKAGWKHLPGGPGVRRDD